MGSYQRNIAEINIEMKCFLEKVSNSVLEKWNQIKIDHWSSPISAHLLPCSVAGKAQLLVKVRLLQAGDASSRTWSSSMHRRRMFASLQL